MTAGNLPQTDRAARSLCLVDPLEGVRVTEAGGVLSVLARGALRDVVDDALLAVLQSVAERPRGVVCDLSGVDFDAHSDADSRASERLAGLGTLPRDWPGIPLAICSRQEPILATMRRSPLGHHLVLRETTAEAVRIIRRRVPPTVVVERLASHPTSPRAARATVTRALLDWRAPHRIGAACAVVSELVNGALAQGEHVEVSVSLASRRVRIAVRDGSPEAPSGIIRTVVAGFCDASGTLSTAEGGKVTWAVLAA